MKINATVTFTFVLLFLMLSAGLVSAFSGFSVGREALKGITQPDSRPNKGKAKAASSSDSAQKDGMALMKEDDIIKSMKERIDSTAKGGSSRGGDKSEEKKEDKPATKPEEKKADNLAKFPIANNVQGVAMEVVATRREGDATLLDVTIKNTSSTPVQFRYTFLSVTDNQGRVVNAETIGLPSEIPANSEVFSGSVKLATSNIQDAKSVTVQLSDYPEQKLQLRLADIPIQ
jgi:hypothetical protein